MGIADLFRPKHRHSDVRVRSEAVRALTSDDAAILIQIARTDRDIGVRRLAIERIEQPDTLAEIAGAESERSLRAFAGERAAELWTIVACDDDETAAGEALGGIVKLGDQHALVEVAVNAVAAALRKRAFGELRDPKALAELAKGDAPQDLRLAAVARIDDGDVLRALAIDTTQKEVGLAAVDKLDDPDRLDNVAQKAKHKAVRQRARKIVQEIAEAEAQKKPGVPDDVKRRRAEKAQLVREVEAVVDSFDFDKAAQVVRRAEEAWQKLGAAEAGDERFAKSAERFWKRKQLYDSQSRSTDELRAIEREAQREKEHAAAQRKPEPEVALDPEAAAAAEVEANLRREEREKRRLEDEAKRAAEAAERDVRRAEDAERGVAIGASLRALCEDMESLALADAKDGRAIDRLLQQAAKAFEQVGKVPVDRDALLDRYSIARGKLVVRMSELREAEDWERFANVPKAEALIQTAKQMIDAPATPDLGNRLRGLQALWKEVGPMPQRRSKELWEQFKALCDQVYDKVKGVRAVESEKFGEVGKIKEALIAEAEALAESSDWAATAEKLKALQASWKDSGHLPRKQGDELWKRFRAACDKFFERRKPMLDAQHAEQGENLAAKHALIARAQAIAAAAPGDGGWGKAIGEIKDLQTRWKEIGFVPRRDADAVYRAFRAACDALFAKRDEARDSEANAHRAEIDAVRAEIAAVTAGGDDSVARAIAVRHKVSELGYRDLTPVIDQMIRHVLATHPDAVKGTELDQTTTRARRDKLIGKVEELLPKAPAVAAGADIAAQLKQAMRANAFGDLRFSGRDPIEAIDELRTQWAEAGPTLDDTDRDQRARFDEMCQRVLDAVAAPGDDERDDRGPRRRRETGRRERRSAEQPVIRESTPVVAPVSSYDEITAPAKLPFAPMRAPTVPAAPVAPVTAAPAVAAVGPAAAAPAVAAAAPAVAAAAPAVAPAPAVARTKSVTTLPPLDELDTGWDLDAADPSGPAATETPDPAANPPSSSDMAGDNATGGDGIDEPGWD